MKIPLYQLTSTKPYLRKKAVLLLYKVFLKFPEALRPAFPRLKEKLEDPDPGVQSAAVNVICELARKNPKNYLSLAPVFFKLMTSSTNNWMLIKIIKLVSEHWNFIKYRSSHVCSKIKFSVASFTCQVICSNVLQWHLCFKVNGQKILWRQKKNLNTCRTVESLTPHHLTLQIYSYEGHKWFSENANFIIHSNIYHSFIFDYLCYKSNYYWKALQNCIFYFHTKRFNIQPELKRTCIL